VRYWKVVACRSGGGDSYALKGRERRREKEKVRGGERGLLVYDVPSGNVSATSSPLSVSHLA